MAKYRLALARQLTLAPDQSTARAQIGSFVMRASAPMAIGTIFVWWI